MGYDRQLGTEKLYVYRKERTMKQVTVRLPEYMHEECTRLAQKHNLPIAAYIRGVLGEYLHLETRMEHLESTVNQCKGQVEHLLRIVGGKGQKVSRAS
jgi:predicted DNA-binding protein